MPSTVFKTFKCRYRKQISILCIDRTNNFVDERRIIVRQHFIIRQIRPCRIYSELFIFTATVNSSIVFVYDIFTFFTVRFYDELLHLFDSQIDRNYTGNTEESRLQDRIGTITQTDFLSYLSRIDIINAYVFLCEIAFYFIRQMLCQFFLVPDRIQQESSVLTKTASHIIHTQIGLYMTSDKIRSIYQISRTNGTVTETKVRASETSRLLRVIREVCLTMLIGIVTDNFYGVLVSTDCSVSTQSVKLSFKHTFATHGDFFFLR